MPRRPALPKDPSQRAKALLDAAVNPPEKDTLPPEPDTAKLGRLGGLKGGHARAVALSPAKRKAIAKKAADARWGSANKSGRNRKGHSKD